MEKMQYSKVKKHSKKLNIKFPEIGIDKLLPIAAILLFVLFLNTILFSDRNLFILKRKLELKESLQEQINHISQENKKLSSQIEYLKNDSFFIEKKAREELGLMREGEEVYILVDYKPVQPQKESSENNSDRWIDKVLAKYRQYRLKDE